ncbi:MAG: putative nucleoside diphosphate sugar epimerase, partial [Actinomycetia bacterium]|nr:putative nucleoside diphosphate sugar epimerase [Actinomycetes bacterium]
MIVVAGGSGTLGRQVVALLEADHQPVRVFVRDGARARDVVGDGVEIVAGDVREPADVERAVRDADIVVSAVQGFAGEGKGTPVSVDRDGNRNLVRAAEAASCKQFVLLSVIDAAAHHPMELHRMKHAAESELLASDMHACIIRAAPYMETWLSLLGPQMTRGAARLFGRGHNPVNFVSARDVAAFVALAIREPEALGTSIDVGGPANLTFEEFTQVFARVTGRDVRVRNVPLPVMRVAAIATKPISRKASRLVHAGIVMDTTDM